MPGLEAKGANSAVHYSSAPADRHIPKSFLLVVLEQLFRELG